MLGRGLMILAMATAVAGCGSSQDLSAGAVLRAASATTRDLKSVQLDLKFGQGFQVQGIDLVSGTGRFRAPSDSDIVAKTRTAQGFLSPEVLTVGGKIYLRIIQLQAFQELTPEEALQYPDVARLLDKDTGLAPAIQKGRNPKLDSGEQVDGVDCYKVEATYGQAELGQALAPVKLTDDIHVTLWVGKSDHFVRRALFEGHLLSATQATSVDVHLHDFNRPVDIPSPS